MFKGKKRQLVLAGLILALGTAVYLNWQFTPSEDFTAMNTGEVSTSTLGEARLVAAEIETGNEELMDTAEDENDSALANTSDNYFKTTLENREKARADALAVLTEIIGDASKNDVDKSEAVSKSAVISQEIKQENAIETLVKAKGFADCIAIVTETQVSVIVPNTKALEANEVSIIKDIAIGQTNISASCINIVQPRKPAEG